MKKLMIIAALAFASAFAFAQDAEIVKIKGRGIGTDKTEALKDAYRDAVERAVGLYVDAEQMMKNEELVKDQILTQSNAYIEKYDVAKETTKPNGLVEVQILAEVRKTALTKKISDVMPTKTFRLSDGLKNEHAKMTTVEKRNIDGAALLKKALEDFDPFVMVADCSLASPEAVIREDRRPDASKNTVAANYLFKCGINQQRFFDTVVPRLKDVLSQVSLSEPREISIPLKVGDAVDVEKMIEAGQRSTDRLKYMHENFIANWPQISIREVAKSETEECFVLVTAGNKYKTHYKGLVYELDAASAKVVSDWAKTVSDRASFEVSLLDASGEPIISRRLSPWSTAQIGVVRRDRIGPYKKSFMVTFVAPWKRGNSGGGSFAAEFEFYSWHEFVIPKDALPEVKDMKIEIVK